MKDVLCGVGFMTVLIAASGIDSWNPANFILIGIGLVLLAIGESLFNER